MKHLPYIHPVICHRVYVFISEVSSMIHISSTFIKSLGLVDIPKVGLARGDINALLCHVFF